LEVDVQQCNFKILWLLPQVLILFLVEKWIPPTRSETAEIGKKTEGILGVNWTIGCPTLLCGYGILAHAYDILLHIAPILELSVKCSYPVCFPLWSPPHPLLYCVLNPLQPLYSQFWANSLVQYCLLST
jgi:hypothetical protein